MKRPKYIQTDFIKFLLERQESQDELDEDERKTMKKRAQEIEDEEDYEEVGEDEEPQSEEEIIERLMYKWRKLKKQYENKLYNRRRRKTL